VRIKLFQIAEKPRQNAKLAQKLFIGGGELFLLLCGKETGIDFFSFYQPPCC
jgi:hypothetical protein